MYIHSQEIEKRIIEELDNIVFYNGKTIDEILPIQDKLLIATSISNSLPDTLPDMIRKYHKVFNDVKYYEYNECIDIRNVYKHLLEEVLLLGIKLMIPIEVMYSNCISIISNLSKNNIDTEPIFKEQTLHQLSKLSLIVMSIAYLEGFQDSLFDAILITNNSLYDKICQNHDQLLDTIEKCKKAGIKVRTRDLGNNKFVVIKDSGKIIKPVGYKEPTFDHLI